MGNDAGKVVPFPTALSPVELELRRLNIQYDLRHGRTPSTPPEPLTEADQQLAIEYEAALLLNSAPKGAESPIAEDANDGLD